MSTMTAPETTTVVGCDRCSARAQIRAYRWREELLMLFFCGHHAAENAAPLIEQGFTLNELERMS